MHLIGEDGWIDDGVGVVFLSCAILQANVKARHGLMPTGLQFVLFLRRAIGEQDGFDDDMGS